MDECPAVVNYKILEFDAINYVSFSLAVLASIDE